MELEAWSFPFDSHNGRVRKWAGMLLSGLVFLTGCGTASRPETNRSAKELPPDWAVPQEPKPEPEPVVIAPVVPAPTPAPASNHPPATFTSPETRWLSLNRWSGEHGYGNARRISTTPSESYSLATSNGVLTVTIGSLLAHWDGLDLRLGFAPMLINGQVYFHALDLRKNLEPLLRGFEWPANTDRVIVIDPGHGGSNTGARSVADGRFEKTFTLDWALRLARLLETNNWRVFLTRTNDVDVSLTNRVDFATQHGADFFLSLHFNVPGSVNGEVAGLETYSLTPAGMVSSLTRGYPDNPAQSFPNNSFDEPNLAYAVRLHAALLKANGHLDRAVRRARFPGVLRGQNCPAVLIEGGYLSNLREARKIADPAYRQKLAEAVAEALR